MEQIIRRYEAMVKQTIGIASIELVLDDGMRSQLEAILLNLNIPIETEKVSEINALLAKTTGLQSGIQLILVVLRSTRGTLESGRITKKLSILEQAPLYFKGQNINKPTREHLNNYVLSNLEYTGLVTVLDKQDNTIKFLEEIRGLLLSRESILKEMSVNLRFMYKEPTT